MNQLLPWENYIYISLPCWHSPTPTKKTSSTNPSDPAMIPRLVCDFYIPRKLGDFKASQPKVGTCWDQPIKPQGARVGWMFLLLKPDANMVSFKLWKINPRLCEELFLVDDIKKILPFFCGTGVVTLSVPLGKKVHAKKFPPRKKTHGRTWLFNVKFPFGEGG